MSNFEYEFIVVPRYKEKFFLLIKDKKEKEYSFPIQKMSFTSKFNKGNKKQKTEIAKMIQEKYGFYSSYYNKNDFYKTLSFKKIGVWNHYRVIVDFNEFSNKEENLNFHVYSKSVTDITSSSAEETIEEIQNSTILIPIFSYFLCVILIGFLCPELSNYLNLSAILYTILMYIGAFVNVRRKKKINTSLPINLFLKKSNWISSIVLSICLIFSFCLLLLKCRLGINCVENSTLWNILSFALVVIGTCIEY